MHADMRAWCGGCVLACVHGVVGACWHACMVWWFSPSFLPSMNNLRFVTKNLFVTFVFNFHSM